MARFALAFALAALVGQHLVAAPPRPSIGPSAVEARASPKILRDAVSGPSAVARRGATQSRQRPAARRDVRVCGDSSPHDLPTLASTADGPIEGRGGAATRC